MLLDVSDINGEHTSLDEVHGVQSALSAGIHRYGAIRARNSGLLSLSIAPTTALQSITSLTAPHNRISTLQGLDAFPCLEFLDLSHNALRVLDSHSASLLCRLRRLHRCDLSHNEMHFVDLDIFSRDHSKSMGDVRTSMLDGLHTLDLSHNQLLEVPDLRCMPALEALFLDYNRIESLSDIDTRVPLVAINTLSLSHNAIPFLQNFLPLTAFAETLRVICVAGNPCVQDATVEACARPWLLWLLPYLNTIDNIPFVHDERDAAARLFRIGSSGGLNYEAMQVMNSPHGAHLETYLRKLIPTALAIRPGLSSVHDMSTGATHDSGVADGTALNTCSVVSSSAQPHDEVRMSGKNSFASPPSFSKDVSSVPLRASTEGSAIGFASLRSSTEAVFHAMQKKLRQLSGIVEVLWRESMARRVFATIVLQKHTRGLLARRRLPHAVQRRCARIRQTLRQLRHIAPAVANASIVSTPPAGDALLWSLDERVRYLWAEMEDHRRVLARRKSVAAVTIQRYYRGYIDRKHWRKLREHYDTFVASLRPDIVFLQRVGRAFALRKRLAQEHGRAEEVKQLRAEVRELRQCVNELHASVQQIVRRERLQRYADPSGAMDSIVVRHLAPREVENAAAGALSPSMEESERETDVASIIENL